MGRELDWERRCVRGGSCAVPCLLHAHDHKSSSEESFTHLQFDGSPVSLLRVHTVPLGHDRASSTWLHPTGTQHARPDSLSQ